MAHHASQIREGSQHVSLVHNWFKLYISHWHFYLSVTNVHRPFWYQSPRYSILDLSLLYLCALMLGLSLQINIIHSCSHTSNAKVTCDTMSLSNIVIYSITDPCMVTVSVFSHCSRLDHSKVEIEWMNLGEQKRRNHNQFKGYKNVQLLMEDGVSCSCICVMSCLVLLFPSAWPAIMWHAPIYSIIPEGIIRDSMGFIYLGVHCESCTGHSMNTCIREHYKS